MFCSYQADCVCGMEQEETWPWGCSALTCSCCGPGRKAFRKDFSLWCSKGAKLSHNIVMLLVSIEFRAAADCSVSLSRRVRGLLELLWAIASLLLGQEVLTWSIWPPAICTGDGQPMMPWTLVQMASYQFLCEILFSTHWIHSSCQKRNMQNRDNGLGSFRYNVSRDIWQMLVPNFSPRLSVVRMRITHLFSAILSDPLFIYSSHGEEHFL